MEMMRWDEQRKFTNDEKKKRRKTGKLSSKIEKHKKRFSVFCFLLSFLFWVVSFHLLCIVFIICSFTYEKTGEVYEKIKLTFFSATKNFNNFFVVVFFLLSFFFLPECVSGIVFVYPAAWKQLLLLLMTICAMCWWPFEFQ